MDRYDAREEVFLYSDVCQQIRSRVFCILLAEMETLRCKRRTSVTQLLLEHINVTIRGEFM